MATMKALTIHQPFASLIASGAKHYETRGWKTNHRGRVAIHAGKVWSKDHESAWRNMRRTPEAITLPVTPPLGAILCVCDLVDCIPVEQIRDQLSPLERDLGDYSDGRYAWQLKVVKVAPAPIPMVGKQGLWTWEYEMPMKPTNKPRAYLDTETTGLDKKSRIVEISIVTEDEMILLDTFVNPQIPIPMDAIRVHGITDDMVANAPTIEQLRDKILAIFEQYDVYIYNAEYDIRLLQQSASGFESITSKCVMKPFSELIGDWNSYHGNYKFQSLEKACRHYEVTNPSPHRALGDAISACRVHEAMLSKAVRHEM